MCYYAPRNDLANFNDAKRALSNDLELWRNEAIKLYTTGPGTSMQVNVKEWDGVEHRVLKKNGLEVSTLIGNHAQYINETGLPLFSNCANALKDPRVRFILDNTNTVADFYTVVRLKEIRDHTQNISTIRTSQLSVKSAIWILSFFCALVMPFFSYKSFKSRYILL